MYQKAKATFDLRYDPYLENLETEKISDGPFGIQELRL